MLDRVKPSVLPEKGEFNKKMERLEKKLAQLQQKIKELGIPVAILLDGWSAAGKGTLISKILWGLDPRLFKMHSMEKTTEEQLMRPFLWRYAVGMPQAGHIAIFDRSYCMALLPDGGMVRDLDKMNRDGLYEDINAFEAQLVDSGVLILKFFLHISKEEQARRFKELLGNEDTKWRVTEKDLEQNLSYSRHYNIFSEILEKNSQGPTKWTALWADDSRQTAMAFLESATKAMEDAIEAKINNKPPPTPKPAKASGKVPDILKKVDLSATISDDHYSKMLKQCQQQISSLGYKLYSKRRSVVIVYEGWDASGKGGNIKRLTQDMDPRGYDVFPISAPSADELAHHYLWRFWKGIPKDGHMTIFDRSWYGRVLVERVEGFCDEAAWRRAYKEINDMELHLHRHGVIIIKLWLHVSAEEQLRRFDARIKDPLKQHKIGEEDWRNRAKWSSYYAATNEMLHKTSTSYAPWVIVESESKKFARIKVLKHVAKTLEREV